MDEMFEMDDEDDMIMRLLKYKGLHVNCVNIVGVKENDGIYGPLNSDYVVVAHFENDNYCVVKVHTSDDGYFDDAKYKCVVGSEYTLSKSIHDVKTIFNEMIS